MPVSKGHKNKRLLVGIVLDRSSSMGSVRAETISGTNEQFSALRDSDDADNTLVAMWTFNDKVTPLFTDGNDTDGKPIPALVEIGAVKDLGDGDYLPNGMTAMYDGVGVAIDFLAAEAKKADSVIVVIISDGMENASLRFTSAAIASRVKELQDSGWTFTYIGANQDLTQVSAELGIHQGNVLGYNSDVSGTIAMQGVVASSLRSYTRARSSAMEAGQEVFATNCLYTPEDRTKVGDSVELASGGTKEFLVGDTVDLSTTVPPSDTPIEGNSDEDTPSSS